MSTDVRTYFVYGLYDPAYPCVIRYVGSTHRLLKRYCEHMNGSSSGMFAAYWVNAIKSFGRLPQLAVLRIVHGSKADGVAAEWLEINARRQTLLNGMTVLADPPETPRYSSVATTARRLPFPPEPRLASAKT